MVYTRCMIKTLAKILGGENKVKVMRLFLMNTETPFDVAEAASKLKISPASTRQEINNLLASGMIKKKSYSKEINTKRGSRKKQTNGFVLNSNFPLLAETKALLVESELLDKNSITDRFSKSGILRFIAISGVFIGEDKSRMDALFVIDKIDDKKFRKSVTDLEAEIGKELTYAVFDTEEFLYRTQMFDKLIWDMFDFAHEVVLDKKQFSTMFIRSRR